MQLITVLSVAASMAATASARSAVTLNAECDTSKPLARIHNRCNYDVYLWSVYKGDGCPSDEMVKLKSGETYQENYADPKGGDVGVSIKISKTQQCKGNDITQLEYFLDNRAETPKAFQLNYLDVSYVDCQSNCPTKQEGYYLQAGDSTIRATRKTTDNSWCPILACSTEAECAKMSYILPDDIQTKTCDFDSSMTFYMCGSHAPSDDDDKPAPKPESSKKAETSAPKPTPTSKAPSNEYKVNAAAVTKAAEIKDVEQGPKTKTTVVYVTAYEYINAKRSEHAHAHAHARRHQVFHA